MERHTLAIAMCLAVLAVVLGNVLHRTKRWEDFPNVEFTFDCNDRSIGFYADPEHHCKIFHMCDAYGRRVPHICPNDTKFNQRFRVCDWAYNVKCDEASKWYYLNDLTYETEAPETRKKKP